MESRKFTSQRAQHIDSHYTSEENEQTTALDKNQRPNSRIRPHRNYQNISQSNVDDTASNNQQSSSNFNRNQGQSRTESHQLSNVDAFSDRPISSEKRFKTNDKQSLNAQNDDHQNAKSSRRLYQKTSNLLAWEEPTNETWSDKMTKRSLRDNEHSSSILHQYFELKNFLEDVTGPNWQDKQTRPQTAKNYDSVDKTLFRKQEQPKVAKDHVSYNKHAAEIYKAEEIKKLENELTTSQKQRDDVKNKYSFCFLIFYRSFYLV